MQESIVFLVRVQCRRKESSRSLSHLLMSFLFSLFIARTDRQIDTRSNRSSLCEKLHSPDGSSSSICLVVTMSAMPTFAIDKMPVGMNPQFHVT